MRCPYCSFDDDKVLDSRPARDGEAIRRRRECLRCSRRYTTFEEPERPRVFVIKRDGSREEFSRDKCLTSMIVACGKRPVSIEALQDAAVRIERDLFEEFEGEAPAKAIGARVMRELYALDSVAYVRFASVYREFRTLEDFQRIVDAMRDQPAEPPHSDFAHSNP